MSQQVRVATVPSSRTLEIAQIDAAPPTEGQVRVAVRYCGVCGTDVHAFDTPEMLPPAVFGHEWTGTVEAAGPGVEHVAVGDRVEVAVGPPCGRCAMCRSGHAEHCDTVFAEANGVTPDAPLHGGFASHITVSERRVVRVLDSLSDEQEPLATRRPEGRLTGRVPGPKARGEEGFRLVGDLVGEMRSGIGSALESAKRPSTIVLPHHVVKAIAPARMLTGRRRCRRYLANLSLTGGPC